MISQVLRSEHTKRTWASTLTIIPARLGPLPVTVTKKKSAMKEIIFRLDSSAVNFICTHGFKREEEAGEKERFPS